jgi:hypothetical protein
MVQFILILLGAAGISFLIGFAFGGRVNLPSAGRRPRAAAGPGPEPPPPGTVARIEAAELDESVVWQPEPAQLQDSAAEPVRSRRWRLRDGEGRTIGRVELVETRDAVIGVHSVRIDDFRLTIRTGLDHSRLLDGPTVAAALDGLAAAPQDEHARDRAADALTSPHLWAPGGPEQQETLLLSVLGSDRSALLDGVLILRSQGVVGGDPQRRRDRFDYALPRTAEVAELLDGNPELARALVDRFCPREPAALGPLDDLILAAIRPAAA